MNPHDPVDQFKVTMTLLEKYLPNVEPDIFIDFLKVMELRKLNDRLTSIQDTLDELVNK